MRAWRLGLAEACLVQSAVDTHVQHVCEPSCLLPVRLSLLLYNCSHGLCGMLISPLDLCPTQGLDAPVLASLREQRGGGGDGMTSSVRRIIYVSCGFDAFKHDAVALADGGWRMVHAEGHVLFPGSDHIETVAIFDR